MSSIRIHLSDTQRVCAIDNEETAVWSRELIEKILFEAAKTVSAAGNGTAVSTSVNFIITVDPDDGSLLIEA